MEFLRNEKAKYMVDIPEAKKELERYREEYDQAVKKEKELEKNFKKDFHVYEQYYEILLKLFKFRKRVNLKFWIKQTRNQCKIIQPTGYLRMTIYLHILSLKKRLFWKSMLMHLVQNQNYQKDYLQIFGTNLLKRVIER